MTFVRFVFKIENKLKKNGLKMGFIKRRIKVGVSIEIYFWNGKKILFKYHI